MLTNRESSHRDIIVKRTRTSDSDFYRTFIGWSKMDEPSSYKDSTTRIVPIVKVVMIARAVPHPADWG